MKLIVGQIYIHKDKSDKFEIMSIMERENLIITGPNLIFNPNGKNIDMTLDGFKEKLIEGTYYLMYYNILPSSYGRLLNCFYDI